MLPDPVFTERLILVAITPALIEAETFHSADLPALLSVILPSCWPPEHWEPHVFTFMQKQYAEAPHTLNWHRYVVLRGEQPTLIGTMGAFPRSAAEAEIGYSLLQPWQGLGLATEGVRALVAALLEDDSLHSISAQTLPHLTASIRVLQKCGFHLEGAGDDDTALRFRFQRPGGYPMA